MADLRSNTKVAKSSSLRPEGSTDTKTLRKDVEKLKIGDPAPTRGPSSQVKKQRLEKTLLEKRGSNCWKIKMFLMEEFFKPEAKDSLGLRELVDAIDFQGWTHLFEWPVPFLYE